MARRESKKRRRRIFGKTAVRSHKLNSLGYTRRGGIRL